MASEITGLQVAISFAKGNFAKKTFTLGPITRDVTGTNAVSNVQVVGTSEEALVIGDIGTPGYMICKNLDATNFVEIRPGTGTADAIKLKPGDIACFRCAAAPWAIADTAPVELEYTIIED